MMDWENKLTDTLFGNKKKQYNTVFLNYYEILRKLSNRYQVLRKFFKKSFWKRQSLAE